MMAIILFFLSITRGLLWVYVFKKFYNFISVIKLMTKYEQKKKKMENDTQTDETECVCQLPSVT